MNGRPAGWGSPDRPGRLEKPGTPKRYYVSISPTNGPASELRREVAYGTNEEAALKRLENHGLFDPRVEVATVTEEADQIVVAT